MVDDYAKRKRVSEELRKGLEEQTAKVQTIMAEMRMKEEEFKKAQDESGRRRMAEQMQRLEANLAALCEAAPWILLLALL